jgi:hypothetical protein
MKVSSARLTQKFECKKNLQMTPIASLEKTKLLPNWLPKRVKFHCQTRTHRRLFRLLTPVLAISINISSQHCQTLLHYCTIATEQFGSSVQQARQTFASVHATHAVSA